MRRPGGSPGCTISLVGIFPGLEQALDLTTKGPLVLLTQFVTPAELRAAGKKRLVRHLRAAGGLPNVDALAERALAAAVEQTIAVPAERMTARLIKELAQEALAARARLAEIERELEELLDRHRAHRWRRRIKDQGRSSPLDHHLAEQESVTNAYVCRLLPLACVTPDIVVAILDARQPMGVRLAEMLGNGPLAWEEQRDAWGLVVSRRTPKRPRTRSEGLPVAFSVASGCNLVPLGPTARG